MKKLNRVEIRKLIKSIIINPKLRGVYICLKNNRLELISEYQRVGMCQEVISSKKCDEYDKIEDITDLIKGDYDIKYMIDIIQDIMLGMI